MYLHIKPSRGPQRSGQMYAGHNSPLCQIRKVGEEHQGAGCIMIDNAAIKLPLGEIGPFQTGARG